MNIVTFNLRFSWDNDGINSFIHRAGFIYDKLKKEQPDIIAFQEMTPQSLDLLKHVLSDYQFIGQMRSENYDGEGLYVAAKKEKFDVLGFEVFWLSPTPYTAGSRYENQSVNPRICLIVKLRQIKTNEIFRLINVHLDDISDEARLLGIEGMFAHIKRNDADDAPIILLGDFNALPQSGVLSVCLKHGFFDATEDIAFTFHDFGRSKEKIDYILLPKVWSKRCKKSGVWTDCHDGIYLSDHYPVYAEILEE